MEEKRKLERFELKVPARIAGETDRDILEPTTRDICAGGAFFHTDQSLPEGTKVRVDLLLPLDRLKGLAEGYDQAHVQLTGKVLRIEPKGMAVCFNSDYSIRPLRGKAPVWQ
jgi:hypothetical protein